MACPRACPVVSNSVEAAGAFKDKGNKAFAKKYFAEAVSMYSKAIECNPGDHVLFSNRCDCMAVVHGLPISLISHQSVAITTGVVFHPTEFAGIFRLPAIFQG